MIFNQVKEVKEFKYGKCIDNCTCGYHWKLGDNLINQVTVYKYLGVELDERLTFQDLRKELEKKLEEI